MVHFYASLYTAVFFRSPLARCASRRPTLKAVTTTTSIEPRRNLLSPRFSILCHRALLHAYFVFGVRVIVLYVTIHNPQARAVGSTMRCCDISASAVFSGAERFVVKSMCYAHNA
jgi:hypothetical protein